MDKTMHTDFAPAERATYEQYIQDFRILEHNKLVVRIINAVPNIILVLNEFRQIIYYNQQLMESLNLATSEGILGLRPGELLHCVHASESIGGCGTTESCQYCGAVMAIMAAQEGQSTTKECRITYKNGDYTEALDLNVSTSRFDIEDHTYTFFSIVDISSDKRRQALERIFFHDVLNTAGSLHTTIELLLSMKDEADQQELLALLPNVSQKLINEVRAQLELVKAEKGDLHVQQHVVNSLQLLEEVVAEYKYVNYQDHCTIQISENPLCTSLITDNHLIKRVIGNMLKNAIEASGKGDVVMLGCEQMTPESVTWYVTNPKFIPREIQLQIFNRTYSTKGLGRGLGTYSMKLIAERYLKGKVRFSSDPERGTRFELTLPISQS